MCAIWTKVTELGMEKNKREIFGGCNQSGQAQTPELSALRMRLSQRQVAQPHSQRPESSQMPALGAALWWSSSGSKVTVSFLKAGLSGKLNPQGKVSAECRIGVRVSSCPGEMDPDWPHRLACLGQGPHKDVLVFLGPHHPFQRCALYLISFNLTLKLVCIFKVVDSEEPCRQV